MAAPFTLSLAPQCRLAAAAAELEVAGAPSVALPAPGDAAVVHRLLGQGASEAELAREATAHGFDAFGRLYTLLFELHDRLLLRRGVLAGGEPLLTSLPLSADCPFGGERIDPQTPRQLSRFAVVRRVGELLVLESPLGHARLILHGFRALALTAALARPRRVAELADAAGLDGATARLALELLEHGGCLAATEEREPLAHWEFHDCLFHARSRFGRHLGGYGATFSRHAAPPPALRPTHPGETVDLARPDLAALESTDPPFTRVLEERRSCRRFGERPLSAAQLGELLFRAARVTAVAEIAQTEIARRPFPGGGGAYELEIYPAVGHCEGLSAGLYHYRPREHRLTRIRERTPEVARLLESAAHVGRTDGPVQVLLILAARFARLGFKYESMVYATVLKDVGVVMQTIYLVATAMELGVCALGGGDSDLFARAAGIDGWEEGAVGELVIGSRAPAQPSP